MSEILWTASELSAALELSRPPVLLDVRWALGDTEGHRKYVDGHIPGAVYVDLPTELAGHGEATDGRHPLPDIADLQAHARRWGIDDESTVVVYDATGNLAAARAWWLLRWAGLSTVRLLDGGLGAWTAAGGETRSGEETASHAGTVTLSPGHLPTVSSDEVASFVGTVLDARAGERYRGEVEPIDLRAGHIPGAISAPTSDNLTPDGVFADPSALRNRFQALGIRPGDQVAVYCGSGVTAAHQIAALAVAGVDATLYPGSWSAWSSDPDRPVETS
ncbi:MULTISPECIES: sulfurtransferase [unclassified Rhodococcus (in: high G+C Gram-positive bacteria)]|uniref:sulfurtransferase n=1 Tax=unclassified Rhodococcus (in: high G+C Gram-positive bacteria) TaxID=192944 RepID=UPI0009EA47BE|nr:MULTISPECIES: sulfurtransferase [unclassified Rhodococcus (in: high G+C Gram-positive bacteria)]